MKWKKAEVKGKRRAIREDRKRMKGGGCERDEGR